MREGEGVGLQVSGEGAELYICTIYGSRLDINKLANNTESKPR
jgi:hypothetical protein